MSTEFTAGAVLVNPETHFKAAVGNAYTYAKVSIVDPELMVSMPRWLTASTSVDAFAHAFEAHIDVVRRTAFADLTALEAIRRVASNLGAAVRDGTNLAARTQMAWAETS